MNKEDLIKEILELRADLSKQENKLYLELEGVKLYECYYMLGKIIIDEIEKTTLEGIDRPYRE